MKKILTLLAVAIVAATLSGCAACCPTTGLAGGLCPCCPFNRPAPCPPPPCQPAYAPVAACAPVPQCAPQCVAWDPCQCAVVSRPGMGGYGAPPAYAQVPQMMPQMASPYMGAPQSYAQVPPQAMQGMPMTPTYYTEPSCGFVETSCGCGSPDMGNVGYGGVPVDYGMAGSCCTPGGMGSPTPADGGVVPVPGE